MCASGFYCSRLSLTFLNILYLAISIVLMALAGYAKKVGIIVSTPLIGGILAVGIFLFFVSLLGIVATIKHHQVMLFFYVIILFLLFIIEFSISISCLALSHNQQVTVIRAAWDHSDESLRKDAMKGLSCCGFDRNDYNDGKREDFCKAENIPLPPSDPTSNSYEFCQDKVRQYSDNDVSYIILDRIEN